MASDDEELWQFLGRARPGRDRRDHRFHERVQDRHGRGHATSRRGRALSRDEIVQAAIRVADAEGADAISMRRIARELNAGAMSLYWHVDSKDELLDLMLDAVEGELQFPEPTGNWRTDLRAMAVNQRSGLHRHQWLMDFIGGRPPLGPNTLRNLERALAMTDKLGLDTRTALNVLGSVSTYVMGVVLREFRESNVQGRDQEAIAEMGAAAAQGVLDEHLAKLRATGQFPNFLRIIEDGIDPDAPETRDERFEFGLQCVLDGIAARLPGAAGQSGAGDD